MENNNSLNVVEKALGSPVAAEYPENALKVRRNLLASSLVSCVIVFGSISLDPTSSIFGFKFIGLTDNLIRIGLAVITIYFLIHFLWYAVDAFMEWRLRVTGTRLSFITTGRFSSEDCDYPDDPKQSTLYSWWMDQASQIGNMKEIINSLENKWQDSESEIRTIIGSSSDGKNLNIILNSLSELNKKVSELKSAVVNTEKTLLSQRIPASLKRFDDWFRLFLKSQNLRWIIIDTLLPIVIGTAAVVVLLLKLIR